MKTKNFTATLYRSAVRGGGTDRYSPFTSSTLTQIVPYSSSLYTVFHSAIYNSVVYTVNCIVYFETPKIFEKFE